MNLLEIDTTKTQELVKNREIKISVIGLGYVGLPLATLFADKGCKTLGVDINKKIVDLVEQGKSHIHEIDSSSLIEQGAKMLKEACPNCGVRLYELNGTFCPSCGRNAEVTSAGVIMSSRADINENKFLKVKTLEDLIEKNTGNGNLRATTSIETGVKEGDILVVTLPTPLKNGKPDMSYMEIATENIANNLEPGKLVIIKSTVSPGTTEGFVKPILERSGLIAGKDFLLAYIPERIAEGNALFEFQNIPRVCGGVDKRSAEIAAQTFSILGPRVYETASPSVAEAAKLFENTFRDVNIALANEFALVCEKLGLDVTEVIDAANTNPKTNILFPSCGVGGYCLTKDSFYLTEPALEKGYEAKLIRDARKLNEKMPAHTVRMAEEMLGDLKGKKIAVFGLSFKGNTDDTRETPAKEICGILKKKEAEVHVHDPFVPKEKQKEFGTVEEDPYKALADADCLIIAAEHAKFKEIDLTKAKMKNKKIVDGRNMLEKEKVRELGYEYRGIGR